MKAPYYDKATNCVFLRGALNPINPETHQAWQSEQEALAFIASLPLENKAESAQKNRSGLAAKLVTNMPFFKRH